VKRLHDKSQKPPLHVNLQILALKLFASCVTFHVSVCQRNIIARRVGDACGPAQLSDQPGDPRRLKRSCPDNRKSYSEINSRRLGAPWRSSGPPERARPPSPSEAHAVAERAGRYVPRPPTQKTPQRSAGGCFSLDLERPRRAEQRKRGRQSDRVSPLKPCEGSDGRRSGMIELCIPPA